MERDQQGSVKVQRLASEHQFTNGFKESANESSQHSKKDAIVKGQEEKEAKKTVVVYSEYLKLDKILSSQQPLSNILPSPAHYEHLFIITHQTYELWFKQVLHELDSVRHFFIVSPSYDENLPEVNRRLNRVVLIFKVLIEQLNILETMTPTDFLEFRDFLYPASGFQSFQFRLIENKLGLKPENRVNFQKQYCTQFNENADAQKAIIDSTNQANMFDLVEKWLENLPSLNDPTCDFPANYRRAFQAYLQDQLNSSQAASECVQKRLQQKRDCFESVVDKQMHAAMVKRGDRKMSQKALQAAVLVSLYKQQRRFANMYNIIESLANIDLSLMKWRYSHTTMVQRIIGSQCGGTGGSSGYNYLRSTLGEQYKVFADLINLPVYMLPAKYVPSYP